eukprot:9999309-Alexandrium_andersonii.AAC.1
MLHDAHFRMSKQARQKRVVHDPSAAQVHTFARVLILRGSMCFNLNCTGKTTAPGKIAPQTMPMQHA